ncbi:DUF6456 domain-containing protein [Rhodopseudomonas boonkerdii]|uniref:DUF6456 domain-containing protein n=1 Tax=Rhodopseudomonas boonkerdii TaxID=475937 RepID=UPI001E382A57|nr:DUF6456 domain-containing protein [Rhodopseudomonas boonkerdii]
MRTSKDRRERPEQIDPHRARHMSLETRQILTEDGIASVLVNDSESPLAWLARRKGRDGRSLIAPHQFIAGEKLRADFTRANMAPRVTASWTAPTGGRPRGSGLSPGETTDVMLASRQRVGHALDACGPEFAGILIDVCCFLRGLEDVERERNWPARSAKVVLQLGLDRLARHYGFAGEAKGGPAKLRTWLAEGVAFEV